MNSLVPVELRPFKAAVILDGEALIALDGADLEEDNPYGDTSISDNFVSDVYLDFDKRARTIESEEYLRTLSGMSIRNDVLISGL